MRIMRAMMLVTFLMFVAACSGQKIQEGVYRGMYGFSIDGSHVDSSRRNSPAENATKPDMSYDQYMQQRKELLNRDQGGVER
jgi:hypothetical protein